MYYSNMRCHHVMLGDYVKTGQQLNADVCIVKKIDTLNEVVYIVPLDGSYVGGWHSANSLFYVCEVAA